MEPPFVFVTGNAGKALETQRILGFRPPLEPLDLPEIQSLDLQEVVVAKAREAWRTLRESGRPSQERPGKKHNRAVVVEETGFELSAFNGFPGPLVKWMLEAVGAEGIARAGLALDDPRVAAVCALAYYEGDADGSGTGEEILLVAQGRTEGVLTLPPRGEHGFGWDPVFVPEGETRTYAELEPAVKDRIGHRGRAWREFRELLRAAGILAA